MYKHRVSDELPVTVSFRPLPGIRYHSHTFNLADLLQSFAVRLSVSPTKVCQALGFHPKT